MPPSLPKYTVRLATPSNCGCSTMTCWSACALFGQLDHWLTFVQVAPPLVLRHWSMPPAINTSSAVLASVSLGSTHSVSSYQPWLPRMVAVETCVQVAPPSTERYRVELLSLSA